VSKQGKASRGKHRWIGFQVTKVVPDRKKMKSFLKKPLGEMEWRLYDFENSNNPALCIVRVKLSDSENAVSILNSVKSISTLAKSGKIRLVRERMGLERPPRNR